MPHTFSLTDGTNTISLTSDGVIVPQYDLQPPELREVEAHFGGDGDMLTRPAWQSVTESIEILITGDTVQDVRDKGKAIERMLGKARDNRRVMSLARVYIQANIDNEADTWRSEILAARFVWRDAIDGLPKRKAEATITILRAYYWEGLETALPLSSGAPSTTDPVPLQNDFGVDTNHFTVNSSNSELAGELPAPMRLKIVNAEVGTVNVRNLYLTNTTFIDNTGIHRTGAQNELVHGANYSTGASTNELAYLWWLPDSLTQAFAGRYARILVGFNSAFDGYMQCEVRVGGSGGGMTLYRNEQVRGGGESSFLLDAGALPIPPLLDIPNAADIGVGLRVQKEGGISVNLRYIQITPVGENIYRRLYNVDALLAGDAIVDDAITGTVYQRTDSDTVSWPSVQAYHTPLHVWPGQTNRFRLLYHTATGLGAGNDVTAQAWIRPRRLTV